MKYLAILGLVAACGDTTNVNASELNLNRPVDISFACWGGLRLTNGQPATVDQQIVSTPQPISSCDIRSQVPTDVAPIPVPAGQEDLVPAGGGLITPPGYYAFILQSVPGTVAIARWDVKPVSQFTGGEVLVLDADPLTPGKNGISIGEEPIAIQTDSSGCYEVTANAGSCDMSVLDIDSALSGEGKAKVDRLTVKSMDGKPIRARPAALVTQPPITTIGQVCPATATGLMYVAYPSCHLVAAVDVSTGTVVDGYQWDAAGVATRVTGPVSCPIDECGGGGSPTAGPRPVTLDLEHDARVPGLRRLVIGAENSNAISWLELDPTDRPLSIQSVLLDDPKGDLGVTTVALTPQIGMGGQDGFVNDDSATGGQFQFVYAVATDNSVRVADILGRTECDTQVDPRFAYSIKDVKKLSCFPVGDPANPPRRSGAVGPGIKLPADQIPTSLDVFRSDALPDDSREKGASKLIGYYAMITAANGATFIANIDDDDFYDIVQPTNPLLSPVPLILAHQLRDSITERGNIASIDPGTGAPSQVACDVTAVDPDTGALNVGGPRTQTDPTRGVPSGVIDASKVPLLPNVRHVDCTGVDEPNGKPVSVLAYQAPLTERDLAYPDLMGLRSDENWTMTWEGSLSNDGVTTAVDGPGVRESVINVVDAGNMRISDTTRPFCDAGVEPFDIVQLRGCDPGLGDQDCPIGYACFVHPQSQVTGLGACMLATEADRLANACREYLVSIRRYTVGKAASGELVLLPRKHHLRSEPLDGCDLAHDTCQTIADYDIQLDSPLNPRDLTMTKDKAQWACKVDDARPALAAGKGSCIETCTTDTDCLPGTVCQAGTCMEGVVPPQACVNAPQRYELRGHSAFTVVGTKSGYVHPIIADANGQCIKDPNAGPYMLGRIPLTAPPCGDIKDRRTGELTTGGFAPNPCQETTTDATIEPMDQPVDACGVGGNKYDKARATTGVWFRNRGLSFDLVDPTYPGDASCTLDRAGNGLGDLPLVFTGYQINFRVTAGFAALSLAITPSYPVKIVRGPGQSSWIIDEGDYLSTTLGIPSTLGKVFRVEAQLPGIVNLLQ